MVLVIILSGCAVGKATATTQLKANSCDADSVCEVAKTISTPAGSTSALMLTSDVKAVMVDGSLSAGSVTINGKTISTLAGSTSALMLTSDVKAVMVDGSLSAGTVNAGSVTIVGKTISTLAGSTSALMLTSDVKAVTIDGKLSATGLAGTGSAYVCVDRFGTVFRSLTPCV